MLNVSVKRYENLDIGKRVANSKEKHSWTLTINSIEHQISLTLSKISKKYEIFVNNSSIFRGTCFFSNISYEFRVHDCLMIIKADFKTAELIINGKKFSNLYWKNDLDIYNEGSVVRMKSAFNSSIDQNLSSRLI